MTDHDAIYRASSHLSVIVSLHKHGNATDAELEAAWGRLLALRWKGIESAPRDGTFVILHVDHAEPPVSLGYYDGGPNWLIIEGDIAPTNCRPVHFQPLPPAPVAGKGGV